MASGAGGGIPAVRVAAYDLTGRAVQLPFWTNYMIFRNLGANVGRVYFTEADFTGGVNYVEIPVAAATHPYGEWRGPVETAPGDYSQVYIKGIVGAATIELVAFQRRG